MGQYTTTKFGATVLALRKRHGLRRKDLAKATGVHEDTIKRIEDGRTRDPSFSTVVKIFKCFGYEFGLFIRLSDVMDDSIGDEMEHRLDQIV